LASGRLVGATVRFSSVGVTSLRWDFAMENGPSRTATVRSSDDLRTVCSVKVAGGSNGPGSAPTVCWGGARARTRRRPPQARRGPFVKLAGRSPSTLRTPTRQIKTRPSPEQPSFQPLRRFRQSSERPRISLVMNAAQPVVCPPVHALRLLGKRYCYVRSASQARPDFPRLRYPAVAYRFLLTCVR
jgi:hypothetical protein